MQPDPNGAVRILLVDDDPDDFELTRDLVAEIEGGRYALTWLPSYEEGLRAVCAGDSELCLLDYRLGGRDGVEFLRDATIRGCAVPMVILTGYGDRTVEQEARLAGAFDYIPKAGLDVAGLRRVLRNVLRRADRPAAVGHPAEPTEPVNPRSALLDGVATELEIGITRVLAGLRSVRAALAESPTDDAAGANIRATLAHALLVGAPMRHRLDELRLLTQLRPGPTRHIRVVDALHAAVAALEPALAQRVRIERSVSASIAIEATPALLEAALLAFLRAAAASIPDAHDTLGTVKVEVSRAGPIVRIRIEDAGSGLPLASDDGARAAQLTLDPHGADASHYDALGRYLVGQLGGYAQRASWFGAGSRVQIELPGAIDAPPALPGPTPAAADGPRRARILVVDDEVMITRLLGKLLQAHHDVETFSNPADALARVAEGATFDLILCDLLMPRLTGKDLYEELGRIDPDAARRMVFLTGGVYLPWALEFLGAIPNARIEKPFMPAALLQRVRELLDALGPVEGGTPTAA